MNIRPNMRASKRTRERLRQHAPFDIEQEGTCLAFGDELCVLLRSLHTNWLGWIPKQEIEIA